MASVLDSGMELLVTPMRPPAASRPSRRDQIVVLRNIPWKQYDGLCEARKDSAGPRMAYLDGTLEILSPRGNTNTRRSCYRVSWRPTARRPGCR